MSERDDIEQLMRRVEAARILLAQYMGPGPRSAVDTVDRLIDVLDDREFVAIHERLNRRGVIKLVD